MAPSRNANLPVESSWRMVEGEHDSFDTSIVPEDDDLILSSNPSQFSGGSQGNYSIGGSQNDDIHDFLSKAEDEQVIMRSPFRPSLPPAARQGSRRQDEHKNKSPEPEFYMPRMDIAGSRTLSGQSSMTIKPKEQSGIRQRQARAVNGEAPPRMLRPNQRDKRHQETEPPLTFFERLSEALPSTIFDIFAWLLGIVGMAFRYVQKPLAALLAVYLVFGGLIIAQNLVTKSIYTSLSPVCRLPGVSFLNLPFCPSGGGFGAPGPLDDEQHVEFDGLMKSQAHFEKVLEKSAQGVSLPLEMKRSETSIRDLRSMVKHSDIQGREELVLEFDGFVETARTASNDLQRFNTRVGSAVDTVISINRWTARYIEGLEQEREAQGWVSGWVTWAFSPFQPPIFSEKMLLDKYVEHTALVSDKIAQLIVEAQAVLRTLTKAEDHLGIIYDFVTRTQKTVQSTKDEVLWQVWTLVGANYKKLHNLNGQLNLLREVNKQRTDAVRQVTELVVELEKIQASLDNLRDRVAEPEIIRGSGRSHVPLSVHIETIDKGVERLEHARSRIRAIENDKIREVIARGKGEERLIDSP